jgi:SAM-dependent methyltransferase
MSKTLSFDRAADYYDQTRGFPPGIGKQVAAALVEFAGLAAADRLLEIGIGTGRIARPLAATLGPTHHLTGIDVSQKMMAQLRAQLPSGVRPPMLVEANATAIPFPSQTFRAIVFVHILHLIREWQDVIQTCRQLLIPGGFLLGGWNSHPDDSSGNRISRKFQEIAASHGISAERQGLSNFQDLLQHLPGAHATEIVAAEWTVERAPRLALQSIADRHFSSAWLIPDETFPAIYADLEAWAKKEWPDRDQAIPETRGFKWMKVEFD